MARTYDLDTWEKGTLVSPAQADLKTGIVTPAKYSGNTPLTPERLEYMSDSIRYLFTEGAASKDIFIGPEEEAPEDAKIIIDDSMVDQKIINVTDEYSESTQDSYTCNYINGTWLYKNSDGATENITLTDEVENYSKIKILIGSSSSSYGVREIYPNPNYSSISLTGTFWIEASGGSFTVGYLDLSINGKNVTINANRQCNFPQTSTNNGSVTTNGIKIYGIIGYSKTE